MSVTASPEGGAASRRGAQGRVRLSESLRRLEWGPPVAAFIGASMLLWVAARFEGVSFFSALSWYRGDAIGYGSIVQVGYNLQRCVLPGAAHAWCGTAGYFPGYVGVAKVLVGTGLPLVGTLVGVSWIFECAVLVLVWNAALRRAPDPQGYLGLIFVACSPGGVFTRAAFPMSMTVFFSLLWLMGLKSGRWRWAGLAGACAAACFPVMVVLVPLSLLWGLLADRTRRFMSAEAIQCAAIVGLGSLAAISMIGARAHALTAWFRFQSNFHHGFHEPFANLWPLFRGLWELGQAQSVRAEGAEVALVALIVLVLALTLVVQAVRHRLTRWDTFLMLCVLVLWLLPATQAHQSYWREDTLVLAPVALLFHRLRGELALLLCLASLTMFPLLAYVFFTGSLS